MSSEYTKPSVGAAGCNYANLTHYNNGSKGMNIPVPAGFKPGSVVPNYGSPGVATLQHGGHVPSCSGYFNIQSAYGQGANNCGTQFYHRMCN